MVSDGSFLTLALLVSCVSWLFDLVYLSLMFGFDICSKVDVVVLVEEDECRIHKDILNPL